MLLCARRQNSPKTETKPVSDKSEQPADGRGYFNAAENRVLFAAYRECHELREHLTKRHASLTRTSRRRRARRIAQGKPKTDFPLKKVIAELADVAERHTQYRSQIAEIAYKLSRNFWKRFYKRRTQGDVSVPPTERDDCVQLATIRIVNVAHRYTPERGSLLGFLTMVARNEFLGHIRKVQNRAVNRIRHVETFYGREDELTYSPEPIDEGDDD